jgi:tRNA dimethylallyltransferase
MTARLLVIVGPTASGKTSLAVELAQRLDAEIVSADSQQCYRGLDAGTAKPTAEEQAQARHHLLDVADPEEQLDAARFIALADRAIDDIRSRGKHVIVAGGTGLWIQALVQGLVMAPAASPEFRAGFRSEAERVGIRAMHDRLKEVDPYAARRIMTNDRVRIERALEVHALSGRPLSELQREHQLQPPRYAWRTLRLDPPRQVLDERIQKRTRWLFESGLLRRETEMILQRRADKALKIIGYRECAEALQTGDWAAAEVKVNQRTRQYARRQQAWFARECAALPWPVDVELAENMARNFFDAVRLSDADFG